MHDCDGEAMPPIGHSDGVGYCPTKEHDAGGKGHAWGTRLP